MSLQSIVKKMVDEAPAAGRVNVNFGPLTVEPIVVRWETDEDTGARKPTKTPVDKWMKSKGLKVTDEMPPLDKGESFQLRFVIDLQDLNPALNFNYEREISIVESSARQKTDWSEIVLPSLVKVFGDNWYDRVLPQNGKAAPVLYVSAENADSLQVKEGKKNYGVPRFTAVFKNKEACEKARDEYYPKRDEDGQVVEEEEGEGGFPQEAIDGAWNLFKSTKMNEKQTLALLKGNPFNLDPDTYGHDNLAELSKALLKASITANSEDGDDEDGDDE